MFTHLHTHTEFSLLDGLSKIPALMERARTLGQEAIAITDHGNLYGAIDFYQAAKAAGLHPVLGMEAYVAGESHRDRDAAARQSTTHLTLLAQNDRGWHNLVTLATKAHLDGFYYNARVDRELLAQHSEGLIVLSGCPSSELHRALQEGRGEDARRIAGWYRETFGDRYYLEVQNHHDPQFTPVIGQTVDLARELALPLVATHDSHYCNPSDAHSHEVLLCIGTNATIDQADRFKLDGSDFYLTSEAEMEERFPELPEALANTTTIAGRCDVSLEFGRLQLPEPSLPAGATAMEHLAALARAGVAERYGEPGGEVAARLDYELEVVQETGFAEYFLIVREIAQFAHERRIAMGVRGSAAASIILYVLGITDIDPLRYGLVFERFLNRERREMPDIDMDFADDRRDEVIRHVADKYGRDRVAQIITFGTLGAKAAIRDTGRALGFSFPEADRIARLIPNQLNITLDQALAGNAELRERYDSDPDVRRLYDTARSLEGVARHAGTHAAGVVIAREPLVENVPLQRPVRGEDDAIPMTQWAMNHCAAVGLLKMDLLGLSNLTVLETCAQLVRDLTGEEVDYQQLADEDAATFALLSRGETFGVFQLESSGMRRYVQELQPARIADLAAMVALYRPGPMEHIPRYIAARHGREPIAYPHPDLAAILDETHGVIVYQDQVLHIARKFAGYSLGQADIMRKAMGKKIPEVMQAERGRFTQGARELGYGDADATTVFELIEPFAGYAFNKAHAVCYGTIAYQTAYLKAHYPAPYMTAILRREAGDADRVGLAIAECARLELRVLPPDINRSQAQFNVERNEAGRLAIRFGLANIKNVGRGAIDLVVAERDKGGPFASLEDFCRRADLRALNKRALESLIKAGALDALSSRGAALAGIDRIVRRAQREQELRASGQTTMFDLFGEEVETPRPDLDLEEAGTTSAEELHWEKELLGAYLSAHPFQRAAADLAAEVTVQAAEVGDDLDGQEIVLAGMVDIIRPLTTKKGDPFAAVLVEDLSGAVEVTVWPEQYARTREIWSKGSIVLLHAKVRTRGERLTVAVDEVTQYVEAPGSGGALQSGAAPASLRPRNGGAHASPPAAPAAAVPEAGERESAAAPAPQAPAPKAVPQETPAPAAAAPPPPAIAEPAPAAFVPAAEPARPGEAAPTLHIRLQETDDPAADQQRLHETMRLVRESPGTVETFLTVDGIGEHVTLALPKCNGAHALIARLGETLGPHGSAAIEALPAVPVA